MGFLRKFFGESNTGLRESSGSKPATQSDKRKILLAEKSITIQKIIELVLPGERFDLLVVKDLNSLHGEVRGSHVALVLLAAEFAGDGYKLCAELKNHPQSEHLPVIILHALHQPAPDISGSGAPDAVLKKPFDPRQLLDLINKLTTLNPNST